MKKRLLLTSVLVILLCVSLIGGATFALFTSEDVVNIAITSGKVEVEANLGDFYYKTFANPSWTLAENKTTTFGNIGGMARVDGATLVLDKIVPGNGVKVDVEIKNNSDVAIKYMVKTELTGENTDEVVVNTYCDEDIVDAGWLSLAAGADIADIAVSVELPVEATIQGVQAMVTISVVAVQGDANVWSGEENTDWYDETATEFSVSTPEELAGLATIINSGDNFRGKTITLTEDVDLMGINWEPIGGATSFKGTFDGQGNTIYNLYVDREISSQLGFFGDTADGTVKNLHIHNAYVKGYLQVGTVAGNPYTGSFESITVTGLVQVEGFSYVGGVFGKNLYDDVKNITIDVEDGSYVYANSVSYDPNSNYADENGNVAYRTYVGGVVGFMGEGSHTVENVTSNIDVYGSTCDVGGIAGIAHYGNNFINCKSSGNVYLFNASEESDMKEVGGIAGVWHNETDVTFTDCEFTGSVKATLKGTDYDLTKSQAIVGGAYTSSGKGKLIIVNNGVESNFATTNEVLEDIISEDKAEYNVILGEGEYVIPDVAQGKKINIVGNGDTKVNVQFDGSYEGCDYSLRGVEATFEGVVINMAPNTYSGWAGLKATFNNCTINGAITLYDDTVFNGCTFNVTGDAYNVWTWGADKVEFNGCTFNTDGKSLLVYNSSCDVYVNKCTFNDSTNGTGFTKSAIETGVDAVGAATYNIYITETIVNGFSKNDKCVGYENVVGNKNSISQEYLNIVIDGVDVY